MVNVRTTLNQTVGVIVAFALVGVGLGLTGNIGISFVGDQLGAGGDAPILNAFVYLVFLQSALISWFLGPVVALVSGIRNSRQSSAMVAGISTSVGSFVGFLVMTAVAIAVMAVALPETAAQSTGSSSSAGDVLGELVRPMIVASIPTTVVGGLVGGTESLLK